MSHDLIVAGKAYLDITFGGLSDLPAPGEELLAKDLHLSPGGAAMTAIGAARLGLSVALVAPLGSDLAGRYVRRVLRAEGVTWGGPQADRSPVTTVMPAHGDRAMVTFEPEQDVTAEALSSLEARAVVIGFEKVELAPPGMTVFAVTGHVGVTGWAGRALDHLPPDGTIIANEPEALQLTGVTDAEDAAIALSRLTRVAVVTRGAQGAVAVERGEVREARAPAVRAIDTTGAGDLFTAAYVWAHLRERPLAERLCWATLFASLSVRTFTPMAGVVTLADLAEAGQELGLELTVSAQRKEQG